MLWAHVYNLSTEESETGGSLEFKIQDHSLQHSSLQGFISKLERKGGRKVTMFSFCVSGGGNKSSFQ